MSNHMNQLVVRMQPNVTGMYPSTTPALNNANSTMIISNLFLVSILLIFYDQKIIFVIALPLVKGFGLSHFIPLF